MICPQDLPGISSRLALSAEITQIAIEYGKTIQRSHMECPSQISLVALAGSDEFLIKPDDCLMVPLVFSNAHS